MGTKNFIYIVKSKLIQLFFLKNRKTFIIMQILQLIFNEEFKIIEKEFFYL